MGKLVDWLKSDKENKIITHLNYTVQYLNRCIDSEKTLVKDLSDLSRTKQKEIDNLYARILDLEFTNGCIKDYVEYLENSYRTDKIGVFLVGLGLGIALSALLMMSGVIL